VIRFENLKNGTVRITGLTHADTRLIATMLDRAAFTADHGRELSDAVGRLSAAFRTPGMFPGRIGNITVTGSSSGPAACYIEVGQ
jgi:hypothetical protein